MDTILREISYKPPGEGSYINPVQEHTMMSDAEHQSAHAVPEQEKKSENSQ